MARMLCSKKHNCHHHHLFVVGGGNYAHQETYLPPDFCHEDFYDRAPRDHRAPLSVMPRNPDNGPSTGNLDKRDRAPPRELYPLDDGLAEEI